MALIFHTSVAKRLELKVSKGDNSCVCRIYRGKTGKGKTGLHFCLNRVKYSNISASDYSNSKSFRKPFIQNSLVKICEIFLSANIKKKS